MASVADDLATVVAALRVLYDPRSAYSDRDQAQKLCNDVSQDAASVPKGVRLAMGEAGSQTHFRFYGLTVLEQWIRYHWADSEPMERQYLEQSTWELVDRFASENTPEMLRDKVRRVWVEVIKRQWPFHAEAYEARLCALTQTSPKHREQVASALRVLADDIFVYEEACAVGLKSGLTQVLSTYVLAWDAVPRQPARDDDPATSGQPGSTLHPRDPGDAGWLARWTQDIHAGLASMPQAQLTYVHLDQDDDEADVPSLVIAALSAIVAQLPWMPIEVGVAALSPLMPVLSVPHSALQNHFVEGLNTLSQRITNKVPGHVAQILTVPHLQHIAALWQGLAALGTELSDDNYRTLQNLAELVRLWGLGLLAKDKAELLATPNAAAAEPDAAAMERRFAYFRLALAVAEHPAFQTRAILLPCLQAWARAIAAMQLSPNRVHPTLRDAWAEYARRLIGALSPCLASAADPRFPPAMAAFLERDAADAAEQRALLSQQTTKTIDALAHLGLAFPDLVAQWCLEEVGALTTQDECTWTRLNHVFEIALARLSGVKTAQLLQSGANASSFASETDPHAAGADGLPPVETDPSLAAYRELCRAILERVLAAEPPPVPLTVVSADAESTHGVWMETLSQFTAVYRLDPPVLVRVIQCICHVAQMARERAMALQAAGETGAAARAHNHLRAAKTLLAMAERNPDLLMPLYADCEAVLNRFKDEAGFRINERVAWDLVLLVVLTKATDPHREERLRRAEALVAPYVQSYCAQMQDAVASPASLFRVLAFDQHDWQAPGALEALRHTDKTRRVQLHETAQALMRLLRITTTGKTPCYAVWGASLEAMLSMTFETIGVMHQFWDTTQWPAAYAAAAPMTQPGPPELRTYLPAKASADTTIDETPEAAALHLLRSWITQFTEGLHDLMETLVGTVRGLLSPANEALIVRMLAQGYARILEHVGGLGISQWRSIIRRILRPVLGLSTSPAAVTLMAHLTEGFTLTITPVLEARLRAMEQKGLLTQQPGSLDDAAAAAVAAVGTPGTGTAGTSANGSAAAITATSASAAVASELAEENMFKVLVRAIAEYYLAVFATTGPRKLASTAATAAATPTTTGPMPVPSSSPSPGESGDSVAMHMPIHELPQLVAMLVERRPEPSLTIQHLLQFPVYSDVRACAMAMQAVESLVPALLAAGHTDFVTRNVLPTALGVVINPYYEPCAAAGCGIVADVAAYAPRDEVLPVLLQLWTLSVRERDVHGYVETVRRRPGRKDRLVSTRLFVRSFRLPSTALDPAAAPAKSYFLMPALQGPRDASQRFASLLDSSEVNLFELFS
ncbi:hypothetical protein CXG81DRAFT_26355 [Caulochytrium protostelioides]|uniref:Importin N-terminal domain-containing protein n=1 Tax=Caulochytrium protostelioides TaxID=1555241 RepID=A0A4P9X6X8_9FUNG|nr:hypothetical protein CXG81DRAFT_26355 [Caulochytrium protostelioides]|eukprot:RKP00948.1 hypothetical protein CXG81DRAFT_26355 [Caulochytrium protostelioides]